MSTGSIDWFFDGVPTADPLTNARNDFSELDSVITLEDIENRSEGRTEAHKGNAESNPPHTETPELKRGSREAVYAAYQANIKKSETLRSRITIGIQQGAPLIDLLLQAIECIATMTDDKAFLTINTEALNAMHEQRTT